MFFEIRNVFVGKSLHIYGLGTKTERKQ